MNITSVEIRKTYILKEIESHGVASISDLASDLSVSEMTIRRDLTDLEKEGMVRRVRGGAINASGRSYEPPLTLREQQNIQAKELIGKRAAEMVLEGNSIALDVGSTTLEVAKNLEGKRNITVLTASLLIANQLSSYPDIRTVISGGILRQGENSMVGELARRAFEGLFVDQLFLAVGAIDEHKGLTEYNWDDTLVKKSMIRCSKEVILVADSSKFDRVAFAFVAQFDAIHHLITERMPPEPILAALDEAGVKVHVAE